MVKSAVNINSFGLACLSNWIFRVVDAWGNYPEPKELKKSQLRVSVYGGVIFIA